VRKEAVKVLGVLRVFVGADLRDAFANKLKPQTMQLVDAEFEKVRAP
jgi:hypothetical protein